jgi:tRNA(fMet)-specific endonuclease VapC
MGLVFDTGVFIRLERLGRTDPLAYTARGASMSVSAITVSELLMGAHLADSEARRSSRLAYIEGLIQAVAILDFTAATARVHAQLHATLHRKGMLVGAHDLIIAATAIEHGYKLVTTNRREFERIEGLQVIDFPGPM